MDFCGAGNLCLAARCINQPVCLTMPIKYCTLNLNKKTGGQEYEIFRNAL